MPAQLIEQKGNTIKVQFTFELTGQMLRDEQSLQDVINEAGQAAMGPMLKQFDTKGEPTSASTASSTRSKPTHPRSMRRLMDRFRLCVIHIRPPRVVGPMCRWSRTGVWP